MLFSSTIRIILTMNFGSFCWDLAPRYICSLSVIAIGVTGTLFGSFQRAKPTALSEPCTLEGIDHEEALRLFQGPQEPLRQALEEAGHHSFGRNDARLLQGYG